MSGDVSASCYEDLDESFDGWFAECFNNAETDISSDDMYASWLTLFSLIAITLKSDCFVMWDSGTSLGRRVYKFIFQVHETIIFIPFGCFFSPSLNSPSDVSVPFCSYMFLSLPKCLTIVEFGNSPPACNTNSVQQCVTQTPQNVVFKGIPPF